MKKKVFAAFGIALLTVFSINSEAQKTVGNPLFLHMHDNMVKVDKYANVNGTPFLNDEWQTAAVMLANDVLAENVKVRLNLLENTLHYLDDEGNEMVSTQPVKSVMFKNAASDTSAVFVTRRFVKEGGEKLPDAWMQLLQKGKASLLKMVHKDLQDDPKQYGSATVTQSIVTEVRYYVWYQKELTRVKNVTEIADLLVNSKLYARVDKMKKNSKTEEDMRSAIAYFNNL
jgi:hypothetical protein